MIKQRFQYSIFAYLLKQHYISLIIKCGCKSQDTQPRKLRSIFNDGLPTSKRTFKQNQYPVVYARMDCRKRHPGGNVSGFFDTTEQGPLVYDVVVKLNR